MPKVTDNELDRMFRQAADRISPEFDPQDWQEMSRRLDNGEREAKARNTTLYSMLGLLLLYSIISPWTANDEVREASMVQSPVATELFGGTDGNITQSEPSLREEPVAAHREGEEKNEAIEQPVTRSKATVPDQQSGSLPGDNRDMIHDQPVIGKEPDGTSYTKPLQAEKVEEPLLTETKADEGVLLGTENVAGRLPAGNSFEPGEKHSSGQSNEKMESETGNEGRVQIKGDGSDDSSEGIARSGRTSVYSRHREHQTSVVQRYAEIDVDNIIRPVRLPLIDSVTAETIVKSERTSSRHQWYLKIPVSPDFSAIDFNKLGDAGINLGLMGEYVVGKHLSISAGAIWSKKLYDQKDPDKMYTSGTWSAKPSMLNGDCRVLDIPVNITYYLFPERKTSLFVCLGSSSYIMLKEQYVYTVTWNQNEYLYEENFSNKNNEWFSMLNLSIGIQQKIGKRFFAQAEPFLKAPISGVGEGKVNLMSTGVFLSLKYSLSKGN